MAIHDDREIDESEWIELATRYVRVVVASKMHDPYVSVDDLVQDIMVEVVKRKPRTYYHFRCCCKWGVSHSFRRLLGSDGRKAGVNTGNRHYGLYPDSVVSEVDRSFDAVTLLRDLDDAARRHMTDMELDAYLAARSGRSQSEWARMTGRTTQAVHRNHDRAIQRLRGAGFNDSDD